MRVVLAGDRSIAVSVLEYLIDRGIRPVALMLPDPAASSHDGEILEMCSFLDADHVQRGPNLEQDFFSSLKSNGVDMLLSVHYPYIIREPLLSLPRLGCLNLHPSYLPFNRGWHTPSWAMLEGTPAGATLHHVEKGLDTGPIVHQKRAQVLVEDTADSLYQRLLELELQVFKEAWPAIEKGKLIGQSQGGKGTVHRRRDLFSPDVQKLDLEEMVRTGDLLNKLKALTTSNPTEAAYFDYGGRRYHVRIEVVPSIAHSDVGVEVVQAPPGD